MDRRSKDINWSLESGDGYGYWEPQHYRRALLATLMDVRDELKALNRAVATLQKQKAKRAKKAA